MKTVTVRIPVAVFDDGEWGTAAYCDNATEFEMLSALKDDYGPHERSIVWITAEVPVPEPVEVLGRVG